MVVTTIFLFNTEPLGLRKALRFVISSFVDAVLIWLVLESLAFYTLHHLAAGETYTFAPRGLGIRVDATVHIALLTGMFVIYCLPAFMVRAWLGWMLRVMMFGIFVVFLTFMMLNKVIAIVQTPDHKIIFYPSFPLAPIVRSSVPNAEIRDTEAVVSIQFLTGSPEGISIHPVYHLDSAGQAEVERLRRQIHVVSTGR